MTGDVLRQTISQNAFGTGQCTITVVSINERLSGREQRKHFSVFLWLQQEMLTPALFKLTPVTAMLKKYPSESICSRRVNAPIIVAAAAAVGY